MMYDYMICDVRFSKLMQVHYGTGFARLGFQQNKYGSHLLEVLFPRTSNFYVGKTYKCQKTCFPIFQKNKKNVSTLVPFTFVRPTSAP